MTQKDDLVKHYLKLSKHSQYQRLSKQLEKLIGGNISKGNWRYEKERWAYILQNLDFRGRTVLDIGGNTGYFTFEAIEAGARKVDYYEGNKEHVDFVTLATDVLNLNGKIAINDKYYSFDYKDSTRSDTGFLLNVLHHVGDDYGDKDTSIEQAKDQIIQQLNRMNQFVDTLVFQVGYNWKGNSSLGFFPGGSKKEVIDFIATGSVNHWSIKSVGVAQRTKDGVKYFEISEKSINRNDSLGEFLNRPLFIMEAKK